MQQVRKYQNQLLIEVEKKFGVSVSYESLSPAIFSTFRISNIVVKNATFENNILTIRNARLKYSLLRLIFGGEEVFDTLYLDGVSINWNENIDTDVLNKILEFLPSTSSDKTNNIEDNKNILDSSVFDISLPFDIRANRIKINADFNMASVSAEIKSMIVEQDKSDKSLLLKTSGFIDFFGNNDILNTIGNINTSFSTQVHILPELTGSTVRVNISSVETNDFSLASFDLVGIVAEQKLSLSVLQNTLPIHGVGSFNYETGDLILSLEADKFNPSQFVTFSDESKMSAKYPSVFDAINKAKGIAISGSYAFETNIVNKQIYYTANGDLFIPNSIINGTLGVAYKLTGNKSAIDIGFLQAKSKTIDADFSGSVDLTNFMPQGTFQLNNFTLGNGNRIAFEAYLDKIKDGSTCFIPQLEFGDQLFSALQLQVLQVGDSYDISFEVYDYSHQDFATPGLLKIDGSLLTDGGFFAQVGVSFENIFIDSIMKTVSFFVPQDTQTQISSFLPMAQPYIFSNDLYISTDFKTLSFNSPYALVANTQSDGQVLLFAFDGNENSIQVSQLNMIFAGQSLQASFQADIAENFSDIMFSSSINFNSFPYNVSGSFVPGIALNLVGDYSFNADIDLSSKQSILGSISFDSLPVATNNWILSLSLDSNLYFGDGSDWKISFTKFEAEEVSENIPFSPFLSLAGNATPYGVMIENAILKDDISLLEGNGAFSWNIENGIPTSVAADIEMTNSQTTEAYSVVVDVSNPAKYPLSIEHFINDFYFSAQATVKDFPTSRILKRQEAGNVINASMTALGSLHNPSISVQVFDTSLLIQNVPLEGTFSLFLEDKVIHIGDTGIKWSGLTLSDFAGSFSLRDFTGSLGGKLDQNVGILKLNIPMDISFSPNPNYSQSALESGNPIDDENESLLDLKFPETFAINSYFPQITGSFFDPLDPFSITVTKYKDMIEVYGGPEDSIQGYYAFNDGSIVLSLADNLPIHCNASGTIFNQIMDINITDLYADLSSINGLMNFTHNFALYTAIVSGDLHIGGLLLDPEFTGVLTGTNVDLGIPAYIVPHLVIPTVQITARQKELIVENAVFKPVMDYKSQKTQTTGLLGQFANRKVKNHPNTEVLLDLVMTFDRWGLGNLALDVSTKDGGLIAATVNLPYIGIVADASCDLSFDIQLDNLYMSGSVMAQDAEVGIYPAGNEASSLDTYYRLSPFPYNVAIDLDVTMGQRVQMYMYWPTKTNLLMRAIATPQTKMKLAVDTLAEQYSVDSDIILRGGEIIYLQRNFYLREGRIVFSGDENAILLDPKLTLRAEIREQDNDGNQVKISMSAENQRLSQFNPRFTSSPAKSEQEMMVLLGQAALADLSKAKTASQAVIRGVSTVADYGLQMTMFRQVENGLRDLLKTDIFSIKFPFLQNAAVLAYQVNTTGKQVKVSNFFDNTTVYIGKYFGNSIFFDALLHVSYDENLVQDNKTVGGLVFQPELGLEMASPFATIRWSLAPDIGPDFESVTQKLLVPAVSVSLSWKIVF